MNDGNTRTPMPDSWEDRRARGTEHAPEPDENLRRQIAELGAAFAEVRASHLHLTKATRDAIATLRTEIAALKAAIAPRWGDQALRDFLAD